MGLERSFRDGRVEQWWALEAQGGPYGPERSQRLVVVTTGLATLPERSTSYLVSNLPAPDSSEQAQRTQHSVADLAEVARLYALRGWIEQSYKQVKNSLGWAQYQVSLGHYSRLSLKDAGKRCPSFSKDEFTYDAKAHLYRCPAG